MRMNFPLNCTDCDFAIFSSTSRASFFFCSRCIFPQSFFPSRLDSTSTLDNVCTFQKIIRRLFSVFKPRSRLVTMPVDSNWNSQGEWKEKQHEIVLCAAFCSLRTLILSRFAWDSIRDGKWNSNGWCSPAFRSHRQENRLFSSYQTQEGNYSVLQSLTFLDSLVG